MAQLLISGGAGFIGSHTCLVLEAGHHLVVLDNFSNSSAESLRRVAELAGPGTGERLGVVEGNIHNGIQAVGESVRGPLRYWDVNLSGSRQLLAAMQRRGCHTLVFSSTSTLYGIPEQVPIPATAPIQPINPCGLNKAAVEQLLADRRLGWRTRRGLAEVCRDG